MMLLDTSGLFCIQHAIERGHAEAVALFEAPGAKHTHNYVLSEYVALATARGLPRPAVLGFLRSLADHPDVVITWVGPELHFEAMQLLAARPDKGYSLCDAVSFVLMRRLGATDALTTDRHFEQEAFVRLLKA